MTVSKEVLARVLTAFLALAIEDKELFHPKDIEMVQSNDWWIERFFVNNRTEEEATRALFKTMEWRKDYGVHNLTEDEFNDIKDSGLHIYNITDKKGRPILWNRFTQYKRGVWNKERSKRFLVYIFEHLDQKAGRYQWVMLSDGQSVGKENINLELIYHLSDVLDKHYPRALITIVGLDYPQFFLDVAKDLMKHVSPVLADVVVFVNSLLELTKIINQEQIPEYKLKMWGITKA